MAHHLHSTPGAHPGQCLPQCPPAGPSPTLNDSEFRKSSALESGSNSKREIRCPRRHGGPGVPRRTGQKLGETPCRPGSSPHIHCLASRCSAVCFDSSQVHLSVPHVDRPATSTRQPSLLHTVGRAASHLPATLIFGSRITMGVRGGSLVSSSSLLPTHAQPDSHCSPTPAGEQIVHTEGKARPV